MAKIVFIDTETTSLRHDRRAWEIALIVRGADFKDFRHDGKDGQDWAYTWFVGTADLDLGNADPMSLKIGRFYDRHPYANPLAEEPHTEWDVLREVEHLTRGAFLVGAVPNFDAEVLATRMRAHGICPSWHYHLVDVETLAAGKAGLAPPWDFDAVLELFGLTYDETDRHTALGDARMARDLYDAVLTGEHPTTGDHPKITEETS